MSNKSGKVNRPTKGNSVDVGNCFRDSSTPIELNATRYSGMNSRLKQSGNIDNLDLYPVHGKALFDGLKKGR